MTAPPRHKMSTFLSTLSLRRATSVACGRYCKRYYFYPRSPCGERHIVRCRVNVHFIISIHALLAESDDMAPYMVARFKIISIHALLAESDGYYYLRALADCTFLSTLSLRRATAKVHKTVGHFCAEETHFMESALPSWQ